jgi:hypothetical protein
MSDAQECTVPCNLGQSYLTKIVRSVQSWAARLYGPYNLAWTYLCVMMSVLDVCVSVLDDGVMSVLLV